MTIKPDYVIVGHGPEEKLFTFGPFKNREEASDYADEFSGSWTRWNIIPLADPQY